MVDINASPPFTYEEAMKLALKVRWKVSTCFSGEKCWCRVIVPEVNITDKDGNEIQIVSDGAVNSQFAEHIVNLHNKYL